MLDHSRRAVLLRRAVLFSVAAAVIHGLNVKEHLAEWWGYGFFFLFAAAMQFVYGLVLLIQPWNYDSTGGRRDGSRYSRLFLYAGIAGNLLLIALYVVTRTVGIPLFGPAAGEVEELTFGGIATKVNEVLLVLTLIALVRTEPRR